MKSLIKNSILHVIAILMAIMFIFVFNFEPKLKAQVENQNEQKNTTNQKINNELDKKLENEADKADLTGEVNSEKLNQLSDSNNFSPKSLPMTSDFEPLNNDSDQFSQSSLVSENYETIKNTNGYIGDPQSKERDPFRKPYYIMKLEDQAVAPSEVRINQEEELDKLDSIRRWPLQSYKLTGVIWNVSQPKAMIVDPSGVLHVIKKNYKIGDRNGIVSSIEEGSIIVKQEGVPIIINISKRNQNNQ